MTVFKAFETEHLTLHECLLISSSLSAELTTVSSDVRLSGLTVVALQGGPCILMRLTTEGLFLLDVAVVLLIVLVSPGGSRSAAAWVLCVTDAFSFPL